MYRIYIYIHKIIYIYVLTSIKTHVPSPCLYFCDILILQLVFCLRFTSLGSKISPVWIQPWSDDAYFEARIFGIRGIRGMCNNSAGGTDLLHL
jgi:hypothetical protein